MTKEQQIENELIERLRDLKYTYRPEIRTQADLEQNFRKRFAGVLSQKFVAMNFGDFSVTL